MTAPESTAQEVTRLRAEIQQYQAEIVQLRQTLDTRQQEISRLIQWLNALQQDILAVYNSVSWQIGSTATRLILKLLRRAEGPTARDHIDKVIDGFERWKLNHFRQRRALADSQDQRQHVVWHDVQEYAQWLQQYETLTPAQREAMQAEIATWSTPPQFALLLIADTGEAWQNTVTSLQQQIYPHWRLYIALPEGQAIPPLLHAQPHIQFIKTAQALADTRHALLTQADADWLWWLNSGDGIAPHGLFLAARTVTQQAEARLLYCDEDYRNAQGQRCDPHFKPDWQPDSFYAQDFIGYSGIYRRELALNCEENTAPELALQYASLLRYLTQIEAAHIVHIPRVLYHSAQPLQAPSDAQSQANCAYLQTHLQQQQIAATVTPTAAGFCQLRYALPERLPRVSIIIPTRDRLSLLRGTVDGVLQHTDYPDLELIIVDNGSTEAETLSYLQQIQQDARVKVIRHDAAFNYSHLNNLGAQQASGSILALLNNDLAMIHPDWLRVMVSHALRPEIGAVGARLYYANETLQHAGVIVGLGGLAGHAFKFLLRGAVGYHWKPLLTQNYSAVTGACLVLRRAVFDAVGGLEERLKVAFNDVDLCLKIGALGYRIVWTPEAELYHLESASRGADTTVRKYLRLRQEINFMQARWQTQLQHDPCYNPNLTIEYEDFSLAFPPRWWSDNRWQIACDSKL